MSEYGKPRINPEPPRRLPIDVVLRAQDAKVIEAIGSRAHVEPLLWQLEEYHAPTARHGMRAAEVVSRIAQDRGYDDERTTRLLRGAMLHDVGKTKVSLETLSGTKKKVDFTPADRIELEQHPLEGVQMILAMQQQLEPGTAPDEALPIVAYHHSFQPDPYPEFDPSQIPPDERGKMIRDIKLVAMAEKIDAMLSKDGRNYAANGNGILEPMPYTAFRHTMSPEFYPDERGLQEAIRLYQELYPDNRGVAW